MINETLDSIVSIAKASVEGGLLGLGIGIAIGAGLTHQDYYPTKLFKFTTGLVGAAIGDIGHYFISSPNFYNDPAIVAGVAFGMGAGDKVYDFIKDRVKGWKINGKRDNWTDQIK